MIKLDPITIPCKLIQKLGEIHKLYTLLNPKAYPRQQIWHLYVQSMCQHVLLSLLCGTHPCQHRSCSTQVKVPSHYLPSTYPFVHMKTKAKVQTFINVIHYMWQLSSSTWILLNSKCQHLTMSFTWHLSISTWIAFKSKCQHLWMSLNGTQSMSTWILCKSMCQQLFMSLYGTLSMSSCVCLRYKNWFPMTNCRQ